MSQSTKIIPYVIGKSYIQLTVDGRPYGLDATHPSFTRIKKALKEKKWKTAAKLVSVAESISLETGGSIKVKDGKIYYKEKETKTVIADRIIQLLNQGRPVRHMLKFMDNLYQNPEPRAIEEFYQWLEGNNLPITDDGGFLCYKSINSDNTDCHTGTIDNSPGQIIMTSRNKVDKNWGNLCSSGFHLCSKHYGRYGSKTMAVLTYPKYVLSAPSGEHKIRVTWYEVLKDLGTKDSEAFTLEGFAELEHKLVVNTGKTEMVDLLLACPEIKRNIRKKKLKISTLKKYSTIRLKAMVQKRGLVPMQIGPQDNRFLESSRKASGLTIGQVAKGMGVSYKVVATLEKKQDPPQDRVNSYLEGIAKVQGINLTRSAITYPKTVVV
jgi:hypothetical protein